MSKSKPIMLALMMILMSATPFFGSTAADHEMNGGTAAEMTIQSDGYTLDMWDTHSIDLGQNQENHVDYDVEVTGMTNGHTYDVEMVHLGPIGEVIAYQVSTLTGMGLAAQSTSLSTNASATCSDLIVMTLTEYDGMDNEVGFKDLIWGIEAGDGSTGALCEDDTMLFWSAMDESYAQDPTMHVGMNNPNSENQWDGPEADVMLHETRQIYNSTFHESMDLDDDGNVSHMESMVLTIDLFQDLSEPELIEVGFETYHSSNDTTAQEMGFGHMMTDIHLHGLVTEDNNNGLYGGTIEIVNFIDIDIFNYDLNEDDTGNLVLHNFDISSLDVQEWGDQLWISDAYYVNDTETFESYYMEPYETTQNGDFECEDGDMIPFFLANDGSDDCADGSDEPMDMNNDNKTDNYFTCKDGTMVTMDVVNDYNDDCMEGEDEGKEYHPGYYSLWVNDDAGTGSLSIDIAHPSAHHSPGNNMGYDVEEMDMNNATVIFYPKAWQLDVDFTISYTSVISKQMDTNEDGVIDDDEMTNARYMFQQTFNDGEMEEQAYRFDGEDYSNYVYWHVDMDWSHLGGVDNGGEVTLRMSMWYEGTTADQVTFEIDDFEFLGTLCVEDTDSFMLDDIRWGTMETTSDYCVSGLNGEEGVTLIISLINLEEPMPEMVMDMIADFSMSNHEMGGVVLSMEWIQTMDANTSHFFRTMADMNEDGIVDALEAAMMMEEMMGDGDGDGGHDDEMPTPQDVLDMCDADGDMGISQMELEACTGIDNTSDEYPEFLAAFDMADEDDDEILEYDQEIQNFIDMAADIMGDQDDDGNDNHDDHHDGDHHDDEGEGHHHHGDGDYHHDHGSDDETTHDADDRHHDHHHDNHNGNDNGDHNNDGNDHSDDDTSEDPYCYDMDTHTVTEDTNKEDCESKGHTWVEDDGNDNHGDHNDNGNDNHDEHDHGDHNNAGGPKMVCYWPGAFMTAHISEEECKDDGLEWLPELNYPENPTHICYDTSTTEATDMYDNPQDCESNDGLVWVVERTDENTMWYCEDCNCMDTDDAEGYGEAPDGNHNQCYFVHHPEHHEDHGDHDDGNDFPFFLNGVSVNKATSTDMSQSFTGMEGAVNQSDNVAIVSVVKFWFAGEQQGGDHVVQIIEEDEPHEVMFHCWDSPGMEGNHMEIPFSKVNDGTEDCGDGSDEPRDDDGDGVTDNWFDCHDGQEVSMDVVNDGVWDCSDGEDEGMGHDEDDDSDVNSFVAKFTASPDYDVVNGTHMNAGAYQSFTGEHSVDFGGEPDVFDSYVVFNAELGPCPPGQYQVGGECICQMPGMEVDAYGICVDAEPVVCPDNAHLHGDVCECNPGLIMDATGSCVEDTTSGNDTTTCPDGQHMMDDGTCMDNHVPEPVVDTSPNCYVYYWVGSNADVNGTDWSWTTLKEDWVEFNAPNNGSFTLALPLGDYFVFFNCWDNEGDDIEVSINNMPNQVAMWEDDYNYVTAWADFSITEDMVGGQLDTSIVWSSTTFNGEIDITFKAVESLEDAVEETDVGGLAGLPGFTASIGVMALLGAALILARKEQE